MKRLILIILFGVFYTVYLYAQTDAGLEKRGINLVCIKKKWSFRTSPHLSKLMTQEKTIEKKLSKAAIERTTHFVIYDGGWKKLDYP